MSEHFTIEEKSCPCCGLNLVDQNPDFLRALNSARDLYGSPMNAISMTRCSKHNAEIGGAPNSAHLAGRAADIACDNMEVRMDMTRAFIACGFHRIEYSPIHIHVDMKRGAKDALMLRMEKGIV